MVLSIDEYGELRRQLLLGDPMAGVRYVSKCTGWDRERAKALVYDELRRLQGPDIALPKPHAKVIPPADYDEGILSGIVFLEHPALQGLRCVQREIERITAGANYQVSLEAKALLSAAGRLPLVETVHVCFPEVMLVASRFQRCSVEEMRAEVTECLLHEGDSGAGPQFTVERRDTLAKALLPSYWEFVFEMMGGSTSTVHRYRDELAGYAVFWNFAHVLHSHDGRSALVLAGVSSD